MSAAQRVIPSEIPSEIEQRLQAIIARAFAASPEPWDVYRSRNGVHYSTPTGPVISVLQQSEADAVFIANARQDVPWLCAQLAAALKWPVWQLAATAPKTGEHILVADLDLHHCGFGRCGGKNQSWAAVVHYWDAIGEEGFYLSSGINGPDWDTPVEFTHWMALPGCER